MRVFKEGKDPNKELSDAEVSKYKDFGKVITGYESTLSRLHKKPLYKDPKAFLFLVLVILITYLIVKEQESKDKDLDRDNPIELNNDTP